MTGNILIVDDEEPLRKLLTRIIALEGFKVDDARTLRDAMSILSHKAVDVVLCDVKLPDGNGVDFVKSVKQQFPLVEIILLTAYGNIPDGVQAIKYGAFDYITKATDNDRIVPLLHQAVDRASAAKKSAVRIKEKGGYHFEDIIGNSTVLRDAVMLARKIAPTDSNVLLLGETGTGKEVFASAIHAGSTRADKPFVAINCSAFTRDLLEGELFGHKAGAYTGATKDKKGLVEMADGGALFLDEIGELHPELQAKLLRMIELGDFIKLGDVRTTHVNVRIIAATNRDLSKSVDEGHFRQDLFYRLNVFTIKLPPLRERTEDIPLLAEHFLAHYAAREKKGPLRLSKSAISLLERYPWKGNIRELRNVMERAVVLTDTNVILPEHLPYDLQKQDTGTNNLSLASVERNHIQRVLHHTRGNKTRAAEFLGIGLTTLYRKMEEYHLAR